MILTFKYKTINYKIKFIMYIAFKIHVALVSNLNNPREIRYRKLVLPLNSTKVDLLPFHLFLFHSLLQLTNCHWQSIR